MTRQGVAKHLSVLEQARIVVSERIGRESRFVARAEALDDVSQFLRRASQQWDEAAERLRRMVEE